MIYDGIIEGRYCNLKSVTMEDAEFTLALRKDPNFTKYLPKLNITLEQQREWIKKQQRDPTDYFFVVWDKNENRIGTMGLYDIQDGIGETGRLAMNGNSLQAIEAQLLCVDFAFDILKLKGLKSFILAENKRALKFAELFGPNISEPRKNENGELVCDAVNTKHLYMIQRPKLERMLYRNR